MELEDFTGSATTIYSVIINDEDETLFDKFVKENISSFKSEIFFIFDRLETIGHGTGAREGFFKFYEGDLGDGVVALYDEPDFNLRLYCIRYGSQIVVLGGGGYKSKNIKALQDNEKLKSENYLLRKISFEITSRIKDRRIIYSPGGYNFEGELEFKDDQDA